MRQNIKGKAAALVALVTTASATVTAFAQSTGATGLSTEDMMNTAWVVLIFGVLGYKEMVARNKKKEKKD